MPGKVIDIKILNSKKTERVYDITVNVEKNFIVGGTVVHNCHRIGQSAEKIMVYQMFSKGTIDEDMKFVLKSKQKIIDKLVDGKGLDSANVNIVKDLLDYLEGNKTS